jgi:hypothetical protein
MQMKVTTSQPGSRRSSLRAGTTTEYALPAPSGSTNFSLAIVVRSGCGVTD